MSRRIRLRNATEHQHAALDRLIAAQGYFDSIEGYGEWLLSSLNFNKDMQRLLAKSQGALELPLGALQQRTDLLERDLADLNLTPTGSLKLVQCDRLSAIEALGVLYVTEGASLGARVLLARAKGLGLSEINGARHLIFAARQTLHWHQVLEALETYECGPVEEQPMIAAAQRAFKIALRHWRRP